MPGYIGPKALQWYIDPDFVAARNHDIPPGGHTSYGELCLYFCSLQVIAD